MTTIRHLRLVPKRTTLDTDFFFTRMKQDIKKFYDIHYYGMDWRNRRDLHISLLRENYKPEEFRLKGRALREKKLELLIIIQDIVDRWEFM